MKVRSFLPAIICFSGAMLTACTGGESSSSMAVSSIVASSAISSANLASSSSIPAASSSSSTPVSSSSAPVSSSSVASSSSAVALSSSSAPSFELNVRLKGVTLASAEFGEKEIPGIYETDYIYPNQAEVDYFKSKNMNVIRLPFLWERLQPSLNQAFNQTEFNRLDTFVKETTAKDMYVIIDPHNYARFKGNLIGSGQVSVAAFGDFWKRLAAIYQNNAKVIFAIMNEPHTMATENWLTAANAAAKAIRDTGAKNLMLVPGNAWTGAHSWEQNWYGTANAQVLLNFVDPGNNYAVEVHQYFDADKGGVMPTCSTATGSQYLVQFTKWLETNNKRGFLGEFAGANNETCKQTINDVLQYLDNYRDHWIGWTWWAAGPWWTWKDYMYSIEPDAGVEAPQMSWLTPYLP